MPWRRARNRVRTRSFCREQRPEVKSRQKSLLLNARYNCDIMRHIANGYHGSGRMAVRNHLWTTRKGEERSTWLVNYADGAGVRRAKFFAKKKDADAYHASVKVDVAAGVHTPPAKSITVKQAAAEWIAFVEGERRERATIYGYRSYVELHIIPR